MKLLWIDIGIYAGIGFVALLAIGLVFARLYRRATKETSFVRTGMGGERVIKDGGALVLPVLHDIIRVNMNTLRLEVRRAADQALITKDRMRVDVTAEFYVRVKPDLSAIAQAAQTLGDRTMDPLALKQLVEGKFVDALRAVAAGMEMEQLHENRVDFVQKVQETVAEDLLKNGLELESVSLTGLDQTGKEFFNPDNAFDAEGLRKLTEQIEGRRKERNDIEQDTRIQVELKNLETEQRSLSIRQDEEFARLAQRQEIETRAAEQKAQIAKVAADRRRESEQADIEAEKEVGLARIGKDRDIEQRDIERNRAVQIAEQERDIAVAEKSKDQSAAQAAADAARQDAVRESEAVETVRQTAAADRQKQVQLIRAAEDAEQEAIGVRVAALAEREAAENRALAVRTEADAGADATRMRLEAEAEGTERLNNAKNVLDDAQIRMAVSLALIGALPQIVRESVKPAEKIESIRIFDLKGGLPGVVGAAGNGAGSTAGASNIGEGILGALLAYRAHSPLVDAMLKEAGLDGIDPSNLLTSNRGAAEILHSLGLGIEDAGGENPPAEAASAEDT